mgnify:CR=1 FL=1
MEFSISETGGIDGAEGDQTGRESLIRPYYSYPWAPILCRIRTVSGKREAPSPGICLYRPVHRPVRRFRSLREFPLESHVFRVHSQAWRHLSEGREACGHVPDHGTGHADGVLDLRDWRHCRINSTATSLFNIKSSFLRNGAQKKSLSTGPLKILLHYPLFCPIIQLFRGRAIASFACEAGERMVRLIMEQPYTGCVGLLLLRKRGERKPQRLNGPLICLLHVVALC